MKYRNDKDYPQSFKVNGEWKIVQPGETIELNRLGIQELTPVVDETPKAAEPELPANKEMEAKLEDVKIDLDDDGKRNYSHDPKRKSPGRKPARKKVL